MYMNDVNCTGVEESIWDCPHNGITGYSCYHRDDASAICHGESLMGEESLSVYICCFYTGNGLQKSNCSTGDVRLVGGEKDYEGTVEVCINQVWGSVCGYYYWDVRDGNVVCGQLGHQRLGMLL